MFFSIKSQSKAYPISKAQAYMSARHRLLLFSFGSNEIALNKYFIEHKGIGLKYLCLRLFNDCIWSENELGDIIITFKTKESDKIASFITYGNGKLQGSSILAFAFHRDE